MKLTGNYQELRRKLHELGIPDAPVADGASDVCRRWFRLGEKHLREARQASSHGLKRATYSRAYYAAYNASKAVRYMAFGTVSLKGDDHRKAPDLPSDFPDAATWSDALTRLYENRLRADYDNWIGTERNFSEKPDQAVQSARRFLRTTRTYLNGRFGIWK